jgi:hypothetical protein
VIVAKLTGWGLGDLLGLTVDELLKWHSAATIVNEEIAAKIKEEGQGR